MRSMNKLFWALLVFLTSLMLVTSSVALAKKPDGSSPGKSASAPGHNKVKNKEVPLPDQDVVEGDEESSTDQSEVEQDDQVAPGNSANAPGQAKKLSKGSSDVKGNLKTSQHIYYEGDTIEVSIKFSRGWELLADGTAEAHVVVISPETDLLSFPVDPSIGPNDRKFFSITLESSETLPVGQYQLGLILTLPEGDPANIVDWRNGFRGLLDMEGVLISESFLPEDADMDGECDFDADGDGFCNEESGTDDDDGDGATDAVDVVE